MLSVANCLGSEGYESQVIIFDPNDNNIITGTKSFSSHNKHETMEEAEAELFDAIGQLLMNQLMPENEEE